MRFSQKNAWEKSKKNAESIPFDKGGMFTMLQEILMKGWLTKK